MFMIAQTSSGGVLFQEGMRALATLREYRIDAVVISSLELCEQRTADDTPSALGVREIVLAPIRDVGSMVPGELAEAKKLVFAAADRTADLLRQGKRVLSMCSQGLNRSGLVSALALVRLGFTPADAIARVRDGRGQFALNNDLFCRIIKGEA